MPAKMDLFRSSSSEAEGVVTLYHGSPKKNLTPQYGFGTEANDYGRGFYLTPDYSLACEWSCGHAVVGQKESYVYEYRLDTAGLRMFDFRSIKKYVALYWVCELIKHRTIAGVDYSDNRWVAFLFDNFSTGADSHDVIIGPRADDSYFSYAHDFLNNNLGVSALGLALEEGELGIQYCCKTLKSFQQLHAVGVHKLSGVTFNNALAAYNERDTQARSSVKARRLASRKSPNDDMSIELFAYLWNRRK